jgi:hypothetical protein
MYPDAPLAVRELVLCSAGGEGDSWQRGDPHSARPRRAVPSLYLQALGLKLGGKLGSVLLRRQLHLFRSLCTLLALLRAAAGASSLTTAHGLALLLVISRTRASLTRAGLLGSATGLGGLGSPWGELPVVLATAPLARTLLRLRTVIFLLLFSVSCAGQGRASCRRTARGESKRNRKLSGTQIKTEDPPTGAPLPARRTVSCRLDSRSQS